MNSYQDKTLHLICLRGGYMKYRFDIHLKSSVGQLVRSLWRMYLIVYSFERGLLGFIIMLRSVSKNINLQSCATSLIFSCDRENFFPDLFMLFVRLLSQ